MIIVFNTDQNYLQGGIEKVMTSKAEYFAQLPNTEVYIITTEQNDHPVCFSLDKKIKHIDLGINYNRSKSYFTFENFTKAIKHYYKQRKLFRKIHPDVIISPNFNFDFYWLPFIAKGAKKIKEIHASRYNWKSTFKNRFNRWFEKRYDRIVVLNKDEAAYFNMENVSIIPNLIEKKDKQCDLKQKKVLAAGRIAPVKGFDHLIIAWKEVHDKFPDWQLHIYGQDYLNTKSRLQTLINQLALQDVITFMDSVDDIPDIMLHYSLYALSSVTECFPMVLLEAMSVGLPIVAYDCPNGPRNIFTHQEAGLLVDNQNVSALAEGLMSLMASEQLRIDMGTQGRQNSIQFEPTTVMQKWIPLLTEKKDNLKPDEH